MTAPIYRSVDHLSGEHRPHKDFNPLSDDICPGCADNERLRDENAELRCRVDELTEENKTLTSERATLLTRIDDAYAQGLKGPSLFGGPW